MFKDTFFHTLDENSRVAIPSKWRKGIGNTGTIALVATKGLDSNLWVFTESDWNKYIESRVAKLPIGDDNVRHFIRFFISGASECAVDKSGRIMLPQNLIQYAKLNKDIVFNGAGFYMEIWAVDLWNKYFQENEEKLKDFAKEFFKLPIQDGGS